MAGPLPGRKQAHSVWPLEVHRLAFSWESCEEIVPGKGLDMLPPCFVARALDLLVTPVPWALGVESRPCLPAEGAGSKGAGPLEGTM